MMDVIFPTCILLVGALDDLRSRKIHNRLILILAAFALVFVFCFQINWNIEDLRQKNQLLIFAFLSQFLMAGVLPVIGKSILALGLSVPLVLMKVIGGGDMKLYIVLSFISSPRLLFFSLIFAIVWGGILGLIKSCLDKKFQAVLVNLWLLIQFKRPVSEKLTAFPFSVSLLIGWLTAAFYV